MLSSETARIDRHIIITCPIKSLDLILETATHRKFGTARFKTLSHVFIFPHLLKIRLCFYWSVMKYDMCLIDF